MTTPYETTAAWPFREARRLAEHLERLGKTKGEVIFETGYGPSGLPHIGTFGEVARTSWVRHAFEQLTGRPTRLIMFSDDMDGLRKVPENLPRQDMLKKHLNQPLTSIPDPFEKYESFAHHNNAMLRDFLDRFGFEYDFMSSTAQYRAGRFNDALLKVLQHHGEIVNIVAPTLGEERRKTYSPFLPICPETNEVLQVPVVATNAAAGTLTYQRADGTKVETEVTNGRCKLQWKADWAMRWYAMGVDYEMSGKDLIESVHIGSKINRAIGGTPPVSFTYEHFVDAEGAKISKSKGNGLTIDEWLRYGSPESLGLFMYHRPERTKKLYPEIIPKTVDDYLEHVKKFSAQTQEEQLDNPAWHIHRGHPPAETMPVTFNMLLNLLGATAQEATPDLLWSLIQRYQPQATPESFPQLAGLIENAIAYDQDHILPTRCYRTPTAEEAQALEKLLALLETLQEEASAEDIQTAFYTLGKDLYGKQNLKDWFRFLYETLFGTPQGPRLGSFVTVYGIENTKELVRQALVRDA
jgi:lysyl-tRNA synthetase class 1